MSTNSTKVVETLLMAQNQTLLHLQRIERTLAELVAGQARLEARVMATEQELDAALTDLGQKLTTLGQKMLDAINSLKNKLPPSIDLSDELQTVTDLANEATRLGDIANSEITPPAASSASGG